MNSPVGAPVRRTLSITVSGIAGTLLVLLVAGTCVRLGFWQLDRLAQRRARNAAVEAQLTEPAVALSAMARDTAGLLFRRTHVRGAYDHPRSIVLAGRSYRGAPGVHLLTPVRLADGSAVLVNRGWAPSPDGASLDLAAFAGVDSISGEGLILPLPGTGAERAQGAVDEGFQRVWFRVDPSALARQFPYPLATVQVQLLEGERPAGEPRRLGLPELDGGPHLGYALQWFSFAAIALVGWCALVLRRTTSKRPAAATTAGDGERVAG